MIFEEDALAHYGTPRHSGRYPWGSGGQMVVGNSATFLERMNELKAQGLTDRQMAEGMGLSTLEKDGKNYTIGTTK